MPLHLAWGTVASGCVSLKQSTSQKDKIVRDRNRNRITRKSRQGLTQGRKKHRVLYTLSARAVPRSTDGVSRPGVCPGTGSRFQCVVLCCRLGCYDVWGCAWCRSIYCNDDREVNGGTNYRLRLRYCVHGVLSEWSDIHVKYRVGDLTPLTPWLCSPSVRIPSFLVQTVWVSDIDYYSMWSKKYMPSVTQWTPDVELSRNAWVMELSCSIFYINWWQFYKAERFSIV
jgi:hypothetical protein